MFRRRLATATMLGLALTATAAPGDPPFVSLEEARAKFEAGQVVLIDIREPREHAMGVAAGAKLLPLSQVNQRVAEIPTDPSKPVYIICNSQNRSSALLKSLRGAGGYDHVQFVNGGMSEWARRGWPMVKPAS
ncbi:MAG TPA: rhodanese-like domain-containing protein [Usitatibacteraceae bacterium]|jgi:rhodanese-related sulfurtransferase|nr:rhodanese-like domain-containing protein [Usitatibacteraceae bacterium]